MTKAQIQKRLAALGLRLERNGRSWIVRPDTIGSCMAREVIPLRYLADAEAVIDYREIRQDADHEDNRVLRYALRDPRGVLIETGVCTIAEAGEKAARFIAAMAGEGLAGSIDFTGAGK